MVWRVLWRTVSEVWSLRSTRACGDCRRADCIAQWCLSFASCKRAGLGLVGLKTVRWALLVSRQYIELSLRIFHTTLSHPLFHTTVTRTIFLCNTPSFTCFVTHNSSHTTFLLLDPPPPPLSFLPSPSPLPATTFICWSLLEEVDLWGYPVR